MDAAAPGWCGAVWCGAQAPVGGALVCACVEWVYCKFGQCAIYDMGVTSPNDSCKVFDPAHLPWVFFA